MKRKLFQIVGLLVLSLIMGCVGPLVYASGPYRGRVVDAETKSPIEGAVALLVWHKYLPVGAHMPRVFVDAVEALTDAKGEFAVPEQTHLVLLGTIDKPALLIYFPGYSPYSSTAYKNRLHEVQFRRLKTREERVRFADLSVYVSNNVPAAKVPNLIRLLNHERKELGLPPISSVEQSQLESP